MGEISKEYAARSNGRIVYKKLEKNEGISGNTNACLAMATGEFIGLLDQDDILHPSTLYEYVKAINEKDADYIYCDETTFKSGNIDHMLTMRTTRRTTSAPTTTSAISVCSNGIYYRVRSYSVPSLTAARIMI